MKFAYEILIFFSLTPMLTGCMLPGLSLVVDAVANHQGKASAQNSSNQPTLGGLGKSEGPELSIKVDIFEESAYTRLFCQIKNSSPNALYLKEVWLFNGERVTPFFEKAVSTGISRYTPFVGVYKLAQMEELLSRTIEEKLDRYIHPWGTVEGSIFFPKTENIQKATFLLVWENAHTNMDIQLSGVKNKG